MFKLSFRTIVVTCAALVLAVALPTVSLADRPSAGGPPACREIQQNLGELQADINDLSETIEDLAVDIDAIHIALQNVGLGGLTVDVTVDELGCASGAVQCAIASPPNSTNQNPIALNFLVMRNNQPVTTLSASNFQITRVFGPNGASDLVLCTTGDQGCGTQAFFVNAGNGIYQLWVSPTANWVPGVYTLQVRVTDAQGTISTKLVRVVISA